MKHLKKLKVLNKSMKTVFYERKIVSKEKEREKYDKKLSDIKKNTFVIGREKKIEKISEKIEKLDDDVTTLKLAIADSIDEQLMKRASYALKRWTGAEFETEREKLGEKFSKSSKDKKKQTKEQKTKKETTDALDDLIKSGALDNKDKISDATIKELKKILKVDEEIRDELKEIKENQIDEQDTRIKESKKSKQKPAKTKDIPSKGMTTAKAEGSLLSTLIAAGLSGALIAKIFNDYMKEHGDELVPQWLPDWVKDLKLEDAPEVGTAALKGTATALKGASAAKRGAINGTKKAIKKVSASVGAKNATKKILKQESKNATKAGAKIGGVVYKRIVGETTEAMTKRIAGDMMERAAVKAAGKKIPIAGVSVAFGLAYLRWAQGDVPGAVGEVVSGVASIFPGVGTAISFATDAVLIWRDVANIVEKIEAREAEEKMAKIKRTEGINTIMKTNAKRALDKKVIEAAKSDEKAVSAQSNFDKNNQAMKDYLKMDVSKRDASQFDVLRKNLADSNKVLLAEMNRIRTKLDTTDADNKKIMQDAIKAKRSELSPELEKLMKERQALLALPGANSLSAGGHHKDYYKIQEKLRQNAEKFGKVNARIDQAGQDALTAKNASALASATAEYDRLYPKTSNATIGKSSMNQVIGRNTQMSTSSDKILLDRIAKGEGTLKDGYDTTFSYGKYDPVNRPISTMTLGEIKQFQNGMIANGASSSAVGRYQFIRKTLNEVQKQMGLSDDTVFDAKTQDDMIVYRLNKMRKMDKWKAGKISDTQFQLGLSQEFASIASPYTGKSFYGQHTGTSTSEILKAMSEVKGVSQEAMIVSNDVTQGVVNKDRKDLLAMQVNKNLTNQVVSYDSKVQTSKQIESAQRVAKANQTGIINSQKEADVSLSHGFNEHGPVTT